jgi:Flp pilus assembly protein TadD
MRRTIARLILVQLILVGCAGRPLTVQTHLESGADEVPRAAAELAGANPYLQGRVSVPAEARQRFAQAQVLIEQQDWQAALLELQALEESYPTLSGICLELALVHWQLGDAEQAAHWFQRSIENNASNISAYNEYGIFLRNQGRFAEAEAIYLQALEQWEASADTHRNIGILYDLYVGEPNKALQHYYRYQVLTGETDREVAAWIADLERRQQSAEEGARS